jgi:predicted nuclease of predicted toxin-antitoxin system
MKLLLDKCMPRRLKREFVEHQVLTVNDAGLKGLKNGELLRVAAAQNFDAMLTVDKNLTYQQNAPDFRVAVLVIDAKGNSYEMLKPFASKILEALKTIKSGEIVRVS